MAKKNVAGTKATPLQHVVPEPKPNTLKPRLPKIREYAAPPHRNLLVNRR